MHSTRTCIFDNLLVLYILTLALHSIQTFSYIIFINPLLDSCSRPTRMSYRDETATLQLRFSSPEPQFVSLIPLNMIARIFFFLKRLKIPKTPESLKRIYQINRLTVISVKMVAVIWNPKHGTIQN